MKPYYCKILPCALKNPPNAKPNMTEQPSALFQIFTDYKTKQMANQVMNSASAMLNEQFNYPVPFLRHFCHSQLWESLRYFALTLVKMSPGTCGMNSQMELVNQYLFNLQLLWWWPKLCLNRNRFLSRSCDLAECSGNKMEFCSLFSRLGSTQRQMSAQTGNKGSTTTSSTTRSIHLPCWALYKSKGCN